MICAAWDQVTEGKIIIIIIIIIIIMNDAYEINPM